MRPTETNRKTSSVSFVFENESTALPRKRGAIKLATFARIKKAKAAITFILRSDLFFGQKYGARKLYICFNDIWVADLEGLNIMFDVSAKAFLFDCLIMV